MKEIFYQGVFTSLRSQGIKVLLAMACLMLSSAMLAAGFSGRQPLTVALDTGISGLRLILLLMALFWVQELFGRDLDRKTLYFVLAYPITRLQYLIARFTAIVIILLATLLIVGGLLWAVIFYLDTGYQQATPPALDGRFLLLLLGIWFDLIVITAFMTLIATISTTPFLPMLLGLGFALAARGLGPTFDYLRHNPHADPQQVAVALPVLNIAQVVLPDLSRLDWRVWVLYNQPVQWLDLFSGLLMALAYSIPVVLLAGRILSRRDLT